MDNWDLAKIVLATVYVLTAATLARRAEREIDEMMRNRKVSRITCEIVWSALVALWPITVPIGWVWLSLDKKHGQL